MTIWKWQISKGGGTEIEVPKGTKFLSAQVQKGQIVIWGLLSTGTIRNRTPVGYGI